MTETTTTTVDNSVDSNQNSTASKRRWRDMGLTGAGIASLVRSARQSTDSLRSVASSHRRAANGNGKRTGTNSVASSRPVSTHSAITKDLPGIPPTSVERGQGGVGDEQDERPRRSSSISSAVIHNVPEDGPLEFYEMPPEDESSASAVVAVNGNGAAATKNTPSSVTSSLPPTNALLFGAISSGTGATPIVAPSTDATAASSSDRDVKTPTNDRAEQAHNHKRDTITQQSLRDDAKLQRHGSIVPAGAPMPITTRSASLTNVNGNSGDQSYTGWTTEQERSDGARTPTAATAASTTVGDDVEARQQQTPKIGTTAKRLARKSFTKLSRKSASIADEERQSIGGRVNEPRVPHGATTAAAAAASKRSTAARSAADTQWASDKVGGGDGNTIAQLYAVFGLPKDPTVWTLAEEDCVTGVHHLDGAINRFWRPEVLGCSICPSPSEVLGKISAAKSSAALDVSGASLADDNDGGKWDGRSTDSKKSQSPKFIEMSDGRGGTEKTETARVLSKALKLSFTREVEIVAEQGHYPPKASSHTFSFSVPTVAGASGDAYERSGQGRKAAMATGVSVGMAQAASGVGEGYGLTTQRRTANGSTADGQDGPRLATFYGVALTVWSAADEKRAKVVRKELARAAKQRGQILSTSTMKSGGGGGSKSSDGAANEDSALSATVASPDTIFFMPYAICIVSRFPLYNLLGDWNKMAWHKYSRNIEMHNQLMSTILRHPAPRLGEEVSVGSPDKDVSFHCTFPGAVEWGTGMIGFNFAMWPLFSALSVDNILTICEIALGRNGRVLFISRHPALLGMAVETVRYLVEQCGWRGVAHQNCHARDVRIYLEDPGSWIIGINTELRGIVQVTKEVCQVDLDVNRIDCATPPLDAVSRGSQREKRRRRIMQAVFVSNFECSPPREFVDAYPGGRFRPLSKMITRDLNSAYEQLPQPHWWTQSTAIQAFDAALREGQKPSFIKKVFSSRRSSRAVEASQAELAAILALRKRASTFVDARDGLENKIGRLNKRLAFLMSESEMWRAQFSKIQVLVDRLTKEANDLRGKVDKERRESKRLSSRLAERDIEQVQLQLQLRETESAREEAIQELIRMKTAIESVEQEREAMMDEIRAVLSGGGNVEDVNLSMSRLDLPSFNPLARSDSPTGSQVSMTPSQAAEYILKSRAMAEARISEGRPGRAVSRSDSISSHLVRSLSQDRGEQNRKASYSASSHAGNHFPDEQMNYEIQQRTSIVTDQISRIQQQLESTLTNLEGRRSGTYDRETERRRMRRGSNASIASSRFEYRSSVGHGGSGVDSVNGFASEDGHGRSETEYEPMENVDDEGMTRGARRRRERKSAAPPPTASSQSLRDAYATTSSNASQSSLVLQPPPPPVVGPKSLARRSPLNEWKNLPTSPTDATIKAISPLDVALVNASSASTSAATPSAEVVGGGGGGDTSQESHDASTHAATAATQEQLANGIVAQPLLSVISSPRGAQFAQAGGDAPKVTERPTADVEPSSTAITSDISQDHQANSSISIPSVEALRTPTDTSNVAHGGDWQAESTVMPSSNKPEITVSGGTSPTLAHVSGVNAVAGTKMPDNEVMLQHSGWKLDSEKAKDDAVAPPTIITTTTDPKED